jgi:hypothetical protein
MSKNTIQLKSAIQSLNIKKPYDLRAQLKPTLKAPAQIEEPQIEQPEIQETQNKEPTHGFFMLAHSVFNEEVIQNLSGDAFRIFIWMSAQAWRFKESKGEFRAAVDYISIKCGCSRSTVTRGLADLKKNNLIECVEQNFKKGNLWKVSRIADGRKEDAEIELAQNKVEAGSKSGSSMPNLNKEHAQNEHHIINPNKKFNKSQEAAGDVAEALEERKLIWEKFCEAFPNEADQNVEIQKRLEGFPFVATQSFAKDMAVMKWWEGQDAAISG